MSYTQKKYRPLIILFVLLSLIGGTIWYGMLPLQASLQGKMRGIQEYYAGRENRDRQVSKLPELEAQYNAIIENERSLDILMKENEVVDFVKTVEALAREMNVSMSITSKDDGKIVVPKKPIAKGNGEKNTDILADLPYDKYLSLSLKVEGQYGDIVAFLRKLETLPFGLDVVRVEMTKKAEEKNSDSRATGSAINPFVMLGSSEALSSIQVVQTGSTQEKDILEAVFDVLVYVKKTDL